VLDGISTDTIIFAITDQKSFYQLIKSPKAYFPEDGWRLIKDVVTSKYVRHDTLNLYQTDHSSAFARDFSFTLEPLSHSQFRIRTPYLNNLVASSSTQDAPILKNNAADAWTVELVPASEMTHVGQCSVGLSPGYDVQAAGVVNVDKIRVVYRKRKPTPGSTETTQP
jgi:hypothetical protein